jgi:hypothetical protein
MPGVLYAVQALILFWFALPAWTAATLIKPLSGTNSAFAIALASIFVSGAIGYVFATIHHWLHWNSPTDRNVIDHTDAIAALRRDALLPPPRARSPHNARLEAFDTMSAAWFQRLQPGESMGNAERRVAVFSDLAHAAGAARVASAFSLLTVLGTCLIVAHWSPTFPHTLRFAAMLAWGLFLPLLFHDAYRRTGSMAQRLYDTILEDVLRSKSAGQGSGPTPPAQQCAAPSGPPAPRSSQS